MARSKTFDDEINYVGSSYLRAKRHYIAIIKNKQAHIARWGRRFQQHRDRWAKKLDRELTKLNAKWEAKYNKDVSKLKAQLVTAKKAQSRYALKMNGKLNLYRKRNAKMAMQARRYSKGERFYTKPIGRERSAVTVEMMIRYVYFLEGMFATGELNKYAYIMLLSAYQGEYITKADLAHRYGKFVANKAFLCVDQLVEDGYLVKFNNKPMRVAITDLGWEKVKNVITTCRTRHMRNYH